MLLHYIYFLCGGELGRHACAPVSVWSQSHVKKCVLFFHPVGMRAQTQVLQLVTRCVYQLSHLTDKKKNLSCYHSHITVRSYLRG